MELKNNFTKNLVYIAAILSFAACKKLSSTSSSTSALPTDTISGDIVTVAGDGADEPLSNGSGPAIKANIFPVSIAVDNSSNIYLVGGESMIQKISPLGIISTIAGTTTKGSSTGDGGPVVAATFTDIYSIAVDNKGNIYVIDGPENPDPAHPELIRKIDQSGIITTIAGKGTDSGNVNGGLAINSYFYSPGEIAVDDSDNIYFTDYSANIVRKINTSGIINTVVGVYNVGGYNGDNIPATQAQLNTPVEIAVNNKGNIFIDDELNHRIRKVDASGMITTIAGNGTDGYSSDSGVATQLALGRPITMAVDGSGNLYLSDGNVPRIRKINTSGIITTIAGNETQGYSGDNGPAIKAELDKISSLACDALGNLYIGDIGNYRVRRINK